MSVGVDKAYQDACVSEKTCFFILKIAKNLLQANSAQRYTHSLSCVISNILGLTSHKDDEVKKLCI